MKIISIQHLPFYLAATKWIIVSASVSVIVDGTTIAEQNMRKARLKHEVIVYCNTVLLAELTRSA